jgi:energy-coupling factor transport system permease protein
MIYLLDRNDTSPFGRLSVCLKLLVCFSASCMAVLLDSLLSLALLTVFSAAVFFLSRPTRSQIRFVLFLFAFVMWGVMLSQAMFYNRFPRDAIWTIVAPNSVFRDGLRIYHQGIHHGAIQSFRMIAVGFCGYAVCFSTEPDDFLKGFVALKVPFSLAFMAVSAIQFIPVAVEALLETRTAMGLKGYRPLKRGLGQTVRTEIGALRTVLAGTIRRSEEKSLSILTRGFDFEGKRTFLFTERLSRKECVAIAVLTVTVAAVTAAKSLFWLYQHEIWSASSFRGLYAFTREWL